MGVAETDSGLPATSLCPSCGAEVAVGAELCSNCGKALTTPSVERLVVSLLYVEIESGDDVDVERLRPEMEEVIGEIARIAGARGGRTGNVIGDVVEIVFTVPFARMPARDALHAAEQVRKALNERFNKREWRMAVATGAGVREGDVVVSSAFARARELLRSAATATIEIDDETRRYELVDPSRSDDRLLGREKERASIEGAYLACVAEKRCYRMLLLAEPGLGKSRLAEEMVGKFEGEALSARTRCQPWGESSLAPLEHVMRQIIPGLKEDPAEATRALLVDKEDGPVIVEQICRLFGWGDAPGVPDVSVWSARRLLEELSAKRPIMLLFDDLHWADEPLLDALEDFSTLLSGPVLLLCAARPDLVRRRPEFSLQEANIHTRRLEPLDRAESVALLEASVGGPVEQGAWIDNLLSAAQGSPLFLVEALSQMRDADQLVQQGGLWRTSEEADELAMSPTIEALLATRVTSLARPEREAIEAAAVWGIDFQVDQLQALLPGSQPTELLARFARLRSSDFVEAGVEIAGSPTFRIRHAFIRDAAYELTSKELRADLHQAAAVYSEARQLPDAFTGHHLERTFRLRKELSPADPRNPELAQRAATTLAAAGRGERARGATGSAVELYERAVGVRAERDAGWIDDSIELAECLLNLGRLEAAGAVSDAVGSAAQELGDPHVVAASQLIDAWHKAVVGSTDPEVHETFSRLLPMFEELDDARTLVKIYRGIAEWEWNRSMCGPAAEAMGIALEHCLRTSDKIDLALLVSGLSAASWRGPTTVSLGKIVCERLLHLTAGDPFSRAVVNRRLGVLEALAGDFGSARHRARESRGMLVELGQEGAAAHATQEIGMIDLLAGELRSARSEFKKGFDELGRLGLLAIRSTSAALLGRVLYGLRHPDQALEYISIAEEASEEDPSIGPETFPVRAQIAADRGDRKKAFDLIEAARGQVYESDSLVAQAQVEIHASKTFRKLALSEEAVDAYMKARTLCEEKEAPALLALADNAH